MMKYYLYYFFVLFILLNRGHLFTQIEGRPLELPDIPRFYFSALTFESEETGLTRLDVYVDVPYEAVYFIKKGDKFSAAYDITINIYDSIETLVNEKYWTERLETNDYNQSISPTTSNLSYKSFLLSPGKFFVNVQIKDNETQKIMRMKRKVDVKKYHPSKFTISDIMLVNNLETDSGKIIIHPSISGNISQMHDSFYIYFEIYNTIPLDSAQIVVDIRNVKGDALKSDSFVQPLSIPKKSYIIPLHTTNLIAGDYILKLEAFPITLTDKDKLMSHRTSSTRQFTIRWKGMPASITNLDLAIDQLQYLTDRNVISEMKKASSEKKLKMFNDFWKKKDPTPNTERNELMLEYYSRIEYANKHFGHYIEGWKTDMGMIYVIFGSPSNIERHPFNIDSRPYEIWTYYQINREFIFVDVTGFGDYRLQNPVWELQRLKPR